MGLQYNNLAKIVLTTCTLFFNKSVYVYSNFVHSSDFWNI
jgi:hypothetical protein